jgi:hypothetical protein
MRGKKAKQIRKEVNEFATERKLYTRSDGPLLVKKLYRQAKELYKSNRRKGI